MDTMETFGKLMKAGKAMEDEQYAEALPLLEELLILAREVGEDETTEKIEEQLAICREKLA